MGQGVSAAVAKLDAVAVGRREAVRNPPRIGPGITCIEQGPRDGTPPWDLT